MSNTRHAKHGSPLKQNRFCSSPELPEGLLANMVAKRCSVESSPQDRELIWALQEISHRHTDWADFISGFLAGCVNSIGTRRMREYGTKPGQQYNAEQVRAVRRELPDYSETFLLRGEYCLNRGIEELFYDSSDEARDERIAAAKRPNSFPAADFLSLCRDELPKVESYLRSMCLDPAASVSGPWYFHDLISCLRSYLATTAAKQWLANFGFAQTALSHMIWSEIEGAREIGGATLLYNSAGNGKSFAAKAYCQAHPGRARYALTPATNDDITFVRAIAESLGIYNGEGMGWKAVQLKERIVNVLRGCDLVLVLDNAEFLFPVGDYRYALPARLNWILELAEKAIPIVLIAHSKIFDTLGFVEARTGWNRNKFINQISRMVEFPAALEKKDVQIVAEAMLPDGERAAQRKLADYMIVAPGYLHSGLPAAKRARQVSASRKGDRVTLADIEVALNRWMVPAIKAADSGLKRADAAAQRCKSKVRNWRPETESQLAAKAPKRKQIITSSDVKRTRDEASETQTFSRDEASIKRSLNVIETDVKRTGFATTELAEVGA